MSVAWGGAKLLFHSVSRFQTWGVAAHVSTWCLCCMYLQQCPCVYSVYVICLTWMYDVCMLTVHVHIYCVYSIHLPWCVVCMCISKDVYVLCVAVCVCVWA